MKEQLIKITEAFFDAIDIQEITTIQSGLINNTYKITTDKGDFIVQQLNQNVFKNSSALLNNKIKICRFLESKQFPTITYLRSREGLYYVKDGEDIWQLSNYIPSTVKDRIDSIEVATKAGEHLAQFHEALLDFPLEELEYTIPDFHNTCKRYADFLENVAKANANRLVLAKDEIEKTLLFYPKIKKIATAIQEGIIPLRVVHNDTKINNMLFDDFGSIICLIDFDTIMPGSILHDVGDALRSGANTATEEEKELEKVNFDYTIYEAFMEAYLDIAQGFLTKEELENIHLSLPLLLFEQSCRFLGDFLINDPYYSTQYELQNLVRTKTQLKLLEQVSAYFKL
jgi:N-acetylhexosamine 1-kinase